MGRPGVAISVDRGARTSRRARPLRVNAPDVDEVIALIQRRSRSLYARGRVAEALYSLALDIVGESDLSADDRAWLVDALTAPVAEASQTAIDALISELALAFRTAPPRMRPQVVTRPVSRIDFE